MLIAPLALFLLLLLSYWYERRRDKRECEEFKAAYEVLRQRGEQRKAEMDRLNRRPEDGPRKGR